MEKRSCWNIKLRVSLIAFILIAILFTFSQIGCFGGNSQEEGLEMKEFDVYIEILEGDWPVRSYMEAVFGTMNISFKYPEEWGCYIIPDESEEGSTDIYRGRGGYSNIFIHTSIRIFAEDYSASFNVPEVTSFDPVLKLDMDNICGITIYTTRCESDQNAVVFKGLVYAVDKKRELRIDFESNKGRSIEEYTAVINKFLNTLKIDFNKLPITPAITPY